MAETYKNSLDVKIGTKAVSNMLNNDDNRTFAHELGHSGRIGAYNECGKLDDTEKKKLFKILMEIILKQLS